MANKNSLEKRLIRFKDLIPCKAAFIDAKTPGSHLKDNYSIIGGGVSESKHQKVNLAEPHGFCVGAAGQPPRTKNSPHSHFTAEVFMVFNSAWRFYWNNDENAGGGVVWAPRVIEEAKGHGLVLLENGKLVDTTIGEKIPKGLKPMPKLSAAKMKKFDQYTAKQMRAHVGRVGQYKRSPFKGFPNQTPETLRWFDVLGPQDAKEHKFAVKPGDPNGDQFNVYGLQADSKGKTGKYKRAAVEVMLVHRGKFQVICEHKTKRLSATLSDGDMFTFPKGSVRSITAKMHGFAYFIVGGDYPEAPEVLG